ncbi:hypothetical protein N9J50_03020, partial [Methylophilaceae bacterium]|nr:hypothetical protein [Methylophilaceae bacterium]
FNILLGRVGCDCPFHICKPTRMKVMPPNTLIGPTGNGCIKGNTRARVISENPDLSNFSKIALIGIGCFSEACTISSSELAKLLK